MAENASLDVTDTCTTTMSGEERPRSIRSLSTGALIGYSHSLSTTETNSDSEHDFQSITSLNSTISNLELTIENLQSKYNAMESKCTLYQMENDILRDSVPKYDNKCIEYDKLSEQYDEVKISLMSAMSQSKLYLDQYRNLQLENDALKTKYQQLEQQNTEYQHEVAELRNIRQHLNTNLMSLNDAMNDSQRELYTMKHVKAEENMKLINTFKEEITKLNQQIDDLNKANHALNHENNDDRDSLDGNDTEIWCRKPIRARSISSIKSSQSSLFGESLFTQFVSQDMEVIQGSEEIERIVGEITDSLWHAIDMQVIKIESLLISNQNKSHILDINAPDSVASDDEKSLEYNLDDDIVQLPRRLECIYNELEYKAHKCIYDDANEMKYYKCKRYETLINLKDIQIEQLLNERKGMKTELDAVKNELHELESESQKQDKCNKCEAKDKYEAIMILKDQEIETLLNEIKDIKSKLDVVKSELHELDSAAEQQYKRSMNEVNEIKDEYEAIINVKDVEIERLLNELDVVKNDLHVLQSKAQEPCTCIKNHANEVKNKYQTIINWKDKEIETLLGEIRDIQTELDVIKNVLKSETQKQYKCTNDHHANQMKDEYEAILNVKDVEIERLLKEISEIKTELDVVKNGSNELESESQKQLKCTKDKYEAIINVKNIEMEKLLNDIKELDTELNEYKQENESQNNEIERLKTMKWRYGMALLLVLMFLYLLHRYKSKNNDRVRNALRLIFGRFVVTE